MLPIPSTDIVTEEIRPTDETVNILECTQDLRRMQPQYRAAGRAERSRVAASLLRQADILACPATALLTVENATTFVEVCRQRPAELLVIYTGGFASPTLTQFLARLHAAAPHCALWHWGDWDAGGFRILRHLRQFVPLRALAADPALLPPDQAQLKPLTETDRQSLAALQHEATLADCHTLIAHLLTSNLKLEQEVLSFAAVWPPRT